MTRYVVMVPGVQRPVHVYATDRKAAMAAGAHELGRYARPSGSTAVPVLNDHAPLLAA